MQAPVPGSSSLAGSVLNSASSAGIAGVQVALTGIDQTGRAINVTTSTDSSWR